MSNFKFYYRLTYRRTKDEIRIDWHREEPPPLLVEAVEAVTRRPAALLGNADFGRLYPGGPADLVVLGEDLTIARVLKEGIEVSRR